MTDKTFILGLGAQKCGTTWLHRYLDGAPDCDMGALKEYHVWSGLHAAEFPFFRVRPSDLLKARSGPAGIFDRKAQWLRYRMQTRRGFYERYFSRLASGTVSRTGDISPSYSALSAADLAGVRDRLESAGFEVKVVFLMRDPVERCWSAVRMTRRNDGIGNMASATEAAQLAARFADPIFEARTNYHKTVAAIEDVFEPEKTLYVLFEDMFTPSEHARIASFLGQAPDVAATKEAVNASPKSGEIAPELRAAIRAHYAPVYDYCRERFPRSVELWDGERDRAA